MRSNIHNNFTCTHWLLLMIILIKILERVLTESQDKCTASAAYASKIMTLTQQRIHSPGSCLFTTYYYFIEPSLLYAWLRFCWAWLCAKQWVARPIRNLAYFDSHMCLSKYATLPITLTADARSLQNLSPWNSKSVWIMPTVLTCAVITLCEH